MICSSAVFDFGVLQHNEVYVANSNNQPHPLHPLLVFVSAGYDINAGGVDAGMTEDICKFRDILDVIKIFRSLNKSNAWSNGADYIGGNYNSEWDLIEMVIGIYYPYENEYHNETLTKQKYLDILGHSDFSTTANVYAPLYYSAKLSSAEAMLSGLSLDPN